MTTFQKEASSSNLWLFESHNNLKRSQWLQLTLSEVEEKIKEMLKLTECDADTFSQRAELYYKRRPELVGMIEDFYRSYRSLAGKHDQLKLEPGNSFSHRGSPHKVWSFADRSSASSITFESEFEMDDPLEEEEEDQVESKLAKLPREPNDNDEVENMSGKSSELCFEDSKVLDSEREEESRSEDNCDDEIERLKGENASFRAELERKDEEKREVIRQLTLSIDILKRENDNMRKFIKDSRIRTVFSS